MASAAREIQRKKISLQTPLISSDLDSERRYSSVGLHRRQSLMSVVSFQKELPTISDTFKPTLQIMVPSIVTEEDEGISAVAAHEGLYNQPNNPQRAERMAHFWDSLDKEERCSASPTTSQEFGELGRSSKSPMLRKHRSSIHPRHLRFNFSTSSFQLRLKRKPRSTGALRDPVPNPPQEVANLPNGIHQLGSGIGFTYNMPAQVPSKLSVHSFTPSCGQNFFQGGFSVKNFRRGFGTRKVKAKSASNPSVSLMALPPTATEQDSLADSSAKSIGLREAGSGTFIRDMYRTPSWILSPPDSLPSPMALVTGICDSASPLTSAEPLTPATLVNVAAESEDEVNICISKDLGLDCVLDGALSLAGSTLRLVPPSAARLSFAEGVDTSFSCDPAA